MLIVREKSGGDAVAIGGGYPPLIPHGGDCGIGNH
jgi:hypothetical protein